jgi:Polyphosphate kinase 2 (PPK2)
LKRGASRSQLGSRTTPSSQVIASWNRCGSMRVARRAGIILIKLWLEVGKDQQERRFAARIDDPMRQWKLSPMDIDRTGVGTTIRRCVT